MGVSEFPQRVVVVGNGMVGWKLCDRLSAHDSHGDLTVTVFGEEPRVAYDRVQLTTYFEHRSEEQLSMAPRSWYEERGIELHTSSQVVAIDRESKEVQTADGTRHGYDILVLATGSAAFVPPIPGAQTRGVFVYRTIEDLDAIIAYATDQAQTCAVLGGGLLGLEAARAVQGCGLQTHVVELAPRLMPRQLDDTGAKLLRNEIERMDVSVHVGRRTGSIVGQDCVTGLQFDDESVLPVQMVVISAGIRPRDELARDAGIEIGERGGILVDDHLRTSDPSIYAIGEAALHRDVIYGLVAPGYEMADALAKSLTGQPSTFEGADLSAKLKLMGVDVANFGDGFADRDEANKTIVLQDLVKGVYKKLILNPEGTVLLGGMLVGDASEYGQLLHYARSGDTLPEEPESLILGSRSAEGAAGGVAALPDGAQVCSCNNVSKGDICSKIREEGLSTLAEIKSCTNAGTGCGGCLPMVTDLLDVELAAQGLSAAAFDSYSRQPSYKACGADRTNGGSLGLRQPTTASTDAREPISLRVLYTCRELRLPTKTSRHRPVAR